MRRYECIDLVRGLTKDWNRILIFVQKRKRNSEAKATLKAVPKDITPAVEVVDTTKPTALFQPTVGRAWTVSVALPGSVIAK